MKKINVAIIGSSGFTGSEICRLLLGHRYINKIYPVSREKKNFSKVHPNLISSNLKYITIKEFFMKKPNEIDCVFLCTKSKESYTLAEKILKKKIKIIDLSSAFRFDNNSIFFKAFGYKKKNILYKKNNIAYGLTELNRDKIKIADLVANPGCYAITAILSLAPILNKKFIDKKNILRIDAINGTTGAGNNPKINVTHANATEDILTYNADGHRHAPEIEEKLFKFFKYQGNIDLNTAHGNFRRGIYLRINLPVNKSDRKKINREKILKIFKNFYKKDEFRFIKVISQKRELKKNDKEYNLYPSVTSVIGSNNCYIGLDFDKSVGVIKIIATIDNLVKGAAGSAIQNMNVMFNFRENESLSQYGLF